MTNESCRFRRIACFPVAPLIFLNLTLFEGFEVIIVQLARRQSCVERLRMGTDSKRMDGPLPGARQDGIVARLEGITTRVQELGNVNQYQRPNRDPIRQRL